jgi:hypothetical protein
MKALKIKVPVSVYGPGIYFLYQDNECVYIGGSARNACERASRHIGNGKIFNQIYLLPVAEKRRLPLIESAWINKLRPKYNTNQRGIPPRPKTCY